MAYCAIPKDLNRIKNKLVFGMTARQLVCFGTAAAIGVPIYILTRGTIGNSPAVLLMIVIMAPLFLLAMYEKDGLPAEKILRNCIRTIFYLPGVRPYKTENFYITLTEKEVVNPVQNSNYRKKQRAKQTSEPKYSDSKGKSKSS